MLTLLKVASGRSITSCRLEILDEMMVTDSKHCEPPIKYSSWRDICYLTTLLIGDGAWCIVGTFTSYHKALCQITRCRSVSRSREYDVKVCLMLHLIPYSTHLNNMTSMTISVWAQNKSDPTIVWNGVSNAMRRSRDGDQSESSLWLCRRSFKHPVIGRRAGKHLSM